MEYILQLSMDLPELSKHEALALNPGKCRQYGSILLIDAENPNFERLAFTKKSCVLLFRCRKKLLEKKIHAYPWQSIYKKSFALRINDKSMKEKESDFASIIWKKVDCPKVNLENAETNIEIFFYEDYAFCGLLLHRNNDDFSKRHPEKRPAKHPTTLRPKIAKALINLSGIKKGVLLDPFCGTGGILIESALLGYRTIGYDLSSEMIRRAKKNIDYFKLDNVKLEIKDATSALEKADVIVTDLPYGRASKLFKDGTTEKLYLDFIKQAEKSSNHAIVIFPSTVNFRKLLKHTMYKTKRIIKIKVHRSLTRNITVLEK